MELKQGDLENIILNALWVLEEESNNNKIDVKDVQECIKTEHQSWAYTTVKTVLDRLVEKERILRIKEGKKYLYSTVVPRKHAGEEALRKVLKQYFRNDYNEMASSFEHIGTLKVTHKELITIG